MKKDKIFEHKGYTLVQSEYNNHYMIFDADGILHLHAQCTEPLTEEEAKEHIRNYLKIRDEV